MKRKKIIVLMLATLSLFLFGCNNELPKKEVELLFYAIDEFREMYNLSIKDTTEFNVYLPILTNIEITEVNIEHYGVYIYPKDPVLHPTPDITAKLSLSEEQDKLNTLYMNHYISFIKFNINIENNHFINDYNQIRFTDTKLKISSISKENSMLINDYLNIIIVDSSESEIIIDWGEKLNLLTLQLKHHIMLI